jgi:hypothetical protein
MPVISSIGTYRPATEFPDCGAARYSHLLTRRNGARRLPLR